MSRTIKQIISIIDNNSMCQYYVCYLHILKKKRKNWNIPHIHFLLWSGHIFNVKSWWWKCTWPSLKAMASLRKLAIPYHQWPLNGFSTRHRCQQPLDNPPTSINWSLQSVPKSLYQSGFLSLWSAVTRLSKWWLLTTQVQFCKKTLTAHQY